MLRPVRSWSHAVRARRCKDGAGNACWWPCSWLSPRGPAVSLHLPGPLRTPSHRADELSPRTKFLPLTWGTRPHSPTAGGSHPENRRGRWHPPCPARPQAGLPLFHTAVPLECNQGEGRLHASDLLSPSPGAKHRVLNAFIPLLKSLLSPY